MNMKKTENKREEIESEETRPDRSQLNAVENFYERFRGVPIRYLVIFIGICAAAFVLVVVLGMLKGRGII